MERIDIESTGSVIFVNVDIVTLMKVEANRSKFFGIVATDGKWYAPVDRPCRKRWGEPTEMETPRCYSTIGRCWARCHKEGHGWAPAVWISGDTDIKPIEKYMLITGFQMPGSPTR